MPLDALDINNAALLVIDMQNAFIHEKGTLGISGVDTKRLSSIVPQLTDLVSTFQNSNVPVLWTVQEHFAKDASRSRKKLAGHTARRKQISCLAGSWDAEIIDEMKPLAAHNPSFVIRKHRYGAFHATRLDMLLKQLGVQTLFISGTTTNACIETSIREAYLRDLDVMAVDDCISGVNETWEATAKQVWRQYLCEITTASDVKAWIADQRRPRALNFGHILLMVENMSRSVEFYVDQLGFTIRPAKPLSDGRPFTAFHQGIALVEGRNPMHRQIDHIAFSVNDVEGIRGRLKGKRAHFIEDLHDGPYGKTIYVADPDGVKVELFQSL